MITVRLYKFLVKGICNFLLLTIIFCNNVWSREFTNSNIQFQNFPFLIKQSSAKFSRQFQQKTNKDFSGETLLKGEISFLGQLLLKIRLKKVYSVVYFPKNKNYPPFPTAPPYN